MDADPGALAGAEADADGVAITDGVAEPVGSADSDALGVAGSSAARLAVGGVVVGSSACGRLRPLRVTADDVAVGAVSETDGLGAADATVALAESPEPSCAAADGEAADGEAA